MVESRETILLILLVVLFVSMFVVTFRSKSSTSQTTVAKSWETRSDDQTAVTVEVTPTQLMVGKTAKFDLIFDTHSEELDFDVAKLTNLSDAAGKTYLDSVWQGDPPGGHHRKGSLTFTDPLTNRGKVILTMASVSGVTREFTWIVL